MKNVMNKNKTIIVALLAIISTVFSSPVSAKDKRADPPGVEVKYLGFVDNNPVFEIRTNNVEADNFFITIRDEEGNVLFSEKLSGKSLSRRYRIDTQEEITDGGLQFEVRSLNSKKTEIYIAGMNENITREMAINKIQ